MEPKLKKNLLTALKITISLGLMFWVLRQLDWKQINIVFKQLNWVYMATSILFFISSQLLSVFRFDLFLRKVGVRISFTDNSKLYLLGMFYNFFIPGGIGGDVYKAYVLSKSYNKSLKSLGQVVFLDRFIGLLAIVFMSCLLMVFVKFPFSVYWKYILFLSGWVAVFFILKFIIKMLHVHKKRIHLGFIYAILVQLLQLLSVYFIMKSLGVQGETTAYLLMFLVSSVLSIVSFAGLGMREAVFYYAAIWFQFEPDISALIALSFSMITALVSFLGIIYVLKGIPLGKTIENRMIE